MDQNDTGIDPAQPLARGCTAMRRTIVHDPKQSFAGTVWFLRQHLLDQSAKGGYAGLRFTPAQYIPPTYIPGSQILQGTAALVLVFDIGRSAHCKRQGRVAADAGLDAGLLVGAEDVVLGAKALALPSAGIQVQNPPHRAATDWFAQRCAGTDGDVGQGLPTQRLLGFRQQFTSDCLDQGMVQGGKRSPCGPVPTRPPRKSRLWPTGDAIVAPNADATAPVLRPQHWTQAAVDATAAPTWPAAATGTEQSFAEQSLQPAPKTSRETQDGSSVEAHAWKTSFGESGPSEPQKAPHCINKASPKT